VAHHLSGAPHDRGYINSFAILDHQRHDVKIDEAIFRIKNFHVATKRFAALGKRPPIKAANAFVEPFPDGVCRLQSK
jgi:hypothetical protein